MRRGKPRRRARYRNSLARGSCVEREGGMRTNRSSARNSAEQCVRVVSFHGMRCMIGLATAVGIFLMGSAAVAQVGVIQPDRAPLPADPRHPTIPDFSMQQRAAIYRAVIAALKENRAATLPFDTQIALGGPLPEDARLDPLPDEVRNQIAAANKYRYTVWHDQVLLVDPRSKTVADILHDYVLRDF
jgi:Protein of unknown function (DUF1236)